MAVIQLRTVHCTSFGCLSAGLPVWWRKVSCTFTLWCTPPLHFTTYTDHKAPDWKRRTSSTTN